MKSCQQRLVLIRHGQSLWNQENKFTGIDQEYELLLKDYSENNNKLVSMETQIRLTKWILDKLDSEMDKFNLLPVNLGLEDVSIINSVDKFNELIFKRNKLIKTAGFKNPILVELESQILSVRNSLKESLVNINYSLI